MRQFLQEWRDTLGQDLKFMLPIVDELLAQDTVDLDAVIKERFALRDACEKFSVEYMFHWSAITYFQDINSRFKKGIT